MIVAISKLWLLNKSWSQSVIIIDSTMEIFMQLDKIYVRISKKCIQSANNIEFLLKFIYCSLTF